MERSVIEQCQHHVFISFELQKRESTSCKLYPDVLQRFEAGARQNCMAVFTTNNVLGRQQCTAVHILFLGPTYTILDLKLLLRLVWVVHPAG